MPDTLLGVAIWILVIVIHAGIWMSLCRKAGFSGWWGLFAIPLPGALVVGIMLAVRRWPVRIALRDARVREGSATDEEIYDYFGDGCRLERKGDFEAAMARYEDVARRFADRQPGRDALKYMEALRKGIDRGDGTPEGEAS